MRAPCSFVVGLMVVLARGASAELSSDDVSTDAELFIHEGNSVVVVTVTASGDGTRGTSPNLTLLVEETLSGPVSKGSVVAAWSPPRCDCDNLTVKDPNAAVARWSAMPNPGPAVGSRWIFLLRPRPSLAGPPALEIAHRCRFPFSDEKKRSVVALIEEQRKKEAAYRKGVSEEAAARARAELARREQWDRWVAGLPAQVAKSIKASEVVVSGKVGWVSPSERRAFGFSPGRVFKGSIRDADVSFLQAWLPPEFTANAQGMDVVVFGQRELQPFPNPAVPPEGWLAPGKASLYVVPATPRILELLNAIAGPPPAPPEPPARSPTGPVRYNAVPPQPGSGPAPQPPTRGR